ncbi:MATE family efflux transporter [Cryobacterium breve]|uniref:MATE family efflux transporter n=1 Tax=Cryobacterium breve TaxID=1259258 RepID=A0ABY2IX14_9MICO|nr:MATE family efflux transporter [Cryobacterium sp. TmT3-12]TFC96107.1 MATE family efflux transporter [Cryobacterium breve]
MSLTVLRPQPIDREILRLAIPAVGALIAEPLFLLADSAMVGHLGAVPLAGLGLASAVLQTIIGLMVFLAYSTTPAVARWLGVGDRRRAVGVGIDGLWLALGLGLLLAAAGWFATPLLVGAFGAEPAVTAAAASYLGISMFGLPAMLLVFAATGLLRGLQDTRTPLWVAGIGFSANILLNAVFIYGLNLGIVGSALGTIIAQWAMVGVYLAVVGRHARREGAPLRPHRAGMLLGAASGGWLFLRTVSLRAAMLLAVFVATNLGSPELAAFQIAMTLFATLAFALDALAIAAQALVGRGLGAGNLAEVRAVLKRCLEWGVLSGAALGLLVIAASGVLGRLFTNATEVSGLLPATLIVLGLSVPLGGVVFVLDGVLIGAGDARYLALTGLVNLAAFVPLAVAVLLLAPSGATGLAWLMAAFAFGYLGARAVTLGLRARASHWMVVGAR